MGSCHAAVVPGVADHDGDWNSLRLFVDEFADVAHEQRLRLGAEADPAVVVVRARRADRALYFVLNASMFGAS